MLLVVLAATIATIVSGFYVFFPLEAKIALADDIRLAQRGPLGHGLWATAILFSTRVPTARHFGIVVVGVFCSIVFYRWRETTIATLSENDPSMTIFFRPYLYGFCGVLVAITSLVVVG